MSAIKRSSAVPLSLVPALAALSGCGPDGPKTVSGVDPCLPQVYNQVACETAVKQQGYYHHGTWYHHVYAMPFLFYHNGYRGYVGSGGRVRPLAASTYSPQVGRPAGGRAAVVRGGFGRIGGSRGFAGG